MITRYVLFILILINSIFSCPIPFDIQSKCRCAITEAGRVYIYCARKQLTIVPHFNNSKFNEIKSSILIFPFLSFQGNIIFDELVLSGNRITVVNKNAFNGLKLRKLEFQSNPIETIEDNAFVDLANYLEELIFSTTLLSSELTSKNFLQILFELPNLKRLFLRSFNLSNGFPNENSLILRKLTQLSLQSCLIKQIDDVENFVNLFPNLERLDLSENRLEYFNISLILNLRKLKILNLSKNKIRHLNIHPSTFHPSNSLIELDLSYNGKIHSLNSWNIFASSFV
jgi:Leucine-rich repeat (LRR) protein